MRLFSSAHRNVTGSVAELEDKIPAVIQISFYMFRFSAIWIYSGIKSDLEEIMRAVIRA